MSANKFKKISVNLPVELTETIKHEAKNNFRTFSKQVEFFLDSSVARHATRKEKVARL